MIDAAVLVNTAYDFGLKPPPELTVSEWADEYRWIGAAVSPEPGWWHTERVPYMREIMDVLSPSHPARNAVLMKGSQIAGTEGSLNWVGHTIHFGLGSMLIVLPTQETAKEWSKQRLSQLIEDCECLRGKIMDQRRRDSGNTYFSKKYSGGFIKVAWSTSAKKLRSTPAPFIIADEVDGFEGDTQGEGDPVALLKRRFSNYPRGKFLQISTPTLRHLSRIEREFLTGDRRYCFLPCPFCGHFQRLLFSQLQWDKNDPGTVTYFCLACKTSIPERYKTQMLAGHRWVATRRRPELLSAGFAPADLPGLEPIFQRMLEEPNPSFHLSALYSPLGWYSWAQIATDWEAAQGRPDLLKVFINTVLGETWADKGETPDPEKLYGKRETFDLGNVPARGLFLTASVDVQLDRLEFALDAWGRNRERWGVWYEVIMGDPSTAAPWNKLEELLLKEWPHETGTTMPITAMAIDTGYRPQRVYEFARRHPQPAYGPAGAQVRAVRTVIPVKGGHSTVKPIENISPIDAAKKRAGLRIVTIGTSVLKDELHFLLRLPKPDAGEASPPGYCHFAYPEFAFYQGLCSESRVVRDTGRVEWVKDPAVRNEPLDNEVYNRAMAILCGIDRFREEHWREMERRLKPMIAKPAPPPSERSDPTREWIEAEAGQKPAQPTRQTGVRRPVRGRFEV